MSGIVKALTGGGKKQQVVQQGPSPAEVAAQQERQRKALEERAEADKLAAISLRASSARRALLFSDSGKKQTLGG